MKQNAGDGGVGKRHGGAAAGLALVRSRLEQALPGLEGVEMVRGRSGELWSPRKMLRRAAWHERDHIEHIGKLLAK